MIPGFEEGDFPYLPEQLMLDIVPKSVQQQFGWETSTRFNGELLNLDSTHLEEIVAAMRSAGFSCERRDDVIDQLLW